MSMNVYITASRKITFKKKNGKRGGGIQTLSFNALQTPTNVTYKIVNSADPKQEYIEWVKSCGRVEQIPVYEEDDIFGEKEPIRYDEYDWAAEHIELFEQWIVDVEEEGYAVKFEVA